MSVMIQCDKCKRIFYRDSRSSMKMYAVNIDNQEFHLCQVCKDDLMHFIFPPKATDPASESWEIG